MAAAKGRRYGPARIHRGRDGRLPEGARGAAGGLNFLCYSNVLMDVREEPVVPGAMPPGAPPESRVTLTEPALRPYNRQTVRCPEAL
jgi:hypothetical protein